MRSQISKAHKSPEQRFVSKCTNLHGEKKKGEGQEKKTKQHSLKLHSFTSGKGKHKNSRPAWSKYAERGNGKTPTSWPRDQIDGRSAYHNDNSNGPCKAPDQFIMD